MQRNEPTRLLLAVLLTGLTVGLFVMMATDTGQSLSHQESVTWADNYKPELPEIEQAGFTIAEYLAALDLIDWQESRFGMDPDSFPGEFGPAGEEGRFQITPIFAEDVERITSIPCDPYNYDRCRYQIYCWLDYYAEYAGCETIQDLAKMYRYGPEGFRSRK